MVLSSLLFGRGPWLRKNSRFCRSLAGERERVRCCRQRERAGLTGITALWRAPASRSPPRWHTRRQLPSEVMAEGPLIDMVRGVKR